MTLHKVKTTYRKLKNIGIIAHVDAGKTTLTERILYYTGFIHSVGDVHDGNTVTDSSTQEREKGITISSAAVSVNWKDYQINIIDTPGHIDFNMEVNRALRVLDGAVVVFDAVSGVEPQSETNWRLADKYEVPRICVVNKMDRLGADFGKTVQSIQEKLAAQPLVLQLPLAAEEKFAEVIDLVGMKLLTWADGELRVSDIPDRWKEKAEKMRDQLIDILSDHDEAILEALYGSNSIAVHDIEAAIKRQTLAGNLVPVLCASAYKNKGVEPLLDAVIKYLPSPEDKQGKTVICEQTDRQIALYDKCEPFVALAFKEVVDRHDSLTYLRVYSGNFTKGQVVQNAVKNKNEKISRMFLMQASKSIAVDQISAGDIVAVKGLKHTKTGDTFCATDIAVQLENITAPKPVIDIAIEARKTSEREKLSELLRGLVKEDPSLSMSTNAEGQLILSGMGELHLQVVIARLSTDFGIEVSEGKPNVAFKERLLAKRRVRYVHKKQDGGAGQYACVDIEFEPIDDVEEIKFDDKTVGGCIAKEFISSIFGGIKEQAYLGVISQSPCAGFKATILDGDMHAQDSNAIAFKIAAREAFKQTVIDNVGLLEPIMDVEITTPSESLGDVIGDLNRRRGAICQQDFNHSLAHLKAEVPLANLFGYISHLRSQTSGRATYSMQLKMYRDVPKKMVNEYLRR